uniref:Uncharacterized protein n=1 Tax=Triticum urartu TaxID=4572 RepID=A0A8R7P8D2_TRIUA
MGCFLPSLLVARPVGSPYPPNMGDVLPTFPVLRRRPISWSTPAHQCHPRINTRCSMQP